MAILNGFIDTVGNTPLIRLANLSDETGCEILGKAEFLNPGGSVKDRAALWMIRAAEADGSLKPGGTVVEGTAGNTGIGIAHICNVRRLRLHHLHAGQPVAGKSRHPAHARRRSAGGEDRAVQRSDELSEAGRALCRRAPRRRLGQPVRQRREPAGALRIDRAGNLDRKRAAASTRSRVRSAPAARWPASAAS